MAVVHEPRDLARHAQHRGPREAVLASGQRVGADFHDQALFRPFSHVAGVILYRAIISPHFTVGTVRVLWFWVLGCWFWVLGSRFANQAPRTENQHLRTPAPRTWNRCKETSCFGSF